jgi:hypothetical protein
VAHTGSSESHPGSGLRQQRRVHAVLGGLPGITNRAISTGSTGVRRGGSGVTKYIVRMRIMLSFLD